MYLDFQSRRLVGQGDARAVQARDGGDEAQSQPGVDPHHHFVHGRFFFGPGFAYVAGPYVDDDECYERVWTRWGRRLVSVCY
jgi:hypothetical protein